MHLAMLSGGSPSLLEQVVGRTDTRQMAVYDESCRVGEPEWGRDKARGQRGLVTEVEHLKIGLQLVIETTDNVCGIHPFPCLPRSHCLIIVFIVILIIFMVGHVPVL